MTVIIVAVTIVAMLVIGVAIVMIIVAATRSWARNRADGQAPRLRADARVVDKRSEISGGETRAIQTYYVTFQFPDGNRVELQTTGPESGMLTPGDTGNLEWQGRRFVGFARQILR